MTTALMIRALYGEPVPATARGRALWVCRKERAARAWLTVGSYGWWRYTGYLKAAQRHLLTLRRHEPHPRATGAFPMTETILDAAQGPEAETRRLIVERAADNRVVLSSLGGKLPVGIRMTDAEARSVVAEMTALLNAGAPD